MRIYTTSDVEGPRFRADYRDLRTLAQAPGFSVGTYMCHFGRGNGKRCDKVYDTTVSKGWYNGTKGYGIHQGYKTIWFKDRSLFTPLNRVTRHWGAYVLVG